VSWHWFIVAFTIGMFVGALIWERVGIGDEIRIGKMKIRGRGNRMDTDILKHTVNMKPEKQKRRIFGSRKSKG